jgi:hypothetical protein
VTKTVYQISCLIGFTSLACACLNDSRTKLIFRLKTLKQTQAPFGRFFNPDIPDIQQKGPQN